MFNPNVSDGDHIVHVDQLQCTRSQMQNCPQRGTHYVKRRKHARIHCPHNPPTVTVEKY